MGSQVLVLCFHIWPGDGSFEPKYVAEFLILIAIYVVVLLTGINYLLLQYTTGWLLSKARVFLLMYMEVKKKIHASLRSGMIFSLVLAPISFFYLRRDSVSAD